MNRMVKLILVNTLMVVIVLALFEGFFFVLINSPRLLKECPMRIRNMVGYLYVRQRPTIQYEAACASYDPLLGYRLKPGSCIFGGREFTNEYRINSLGLRDDEDSLDRPEVVVAGDSYAMGWGVDQRDTFAKKLEEKTGLKVLNTAISSYGTAREMIMASLVPRERLRWLIIQYCSNDREENEAFERNGYRLKTMDPDEYRRFTELYRQSQAYYPGKYLYMKIKKRLDEWQAPREQREDNKDEVDLFLGTLINGPMDLRRVQLIVFALNGRDPDDNRRFPTELKKRIAWGDYPPYIKGMTVLDFSDLLKDQHFYVLDDHLNAAGHETIAKEIEKVIRGPKTTGKGP